MFFATIYEGVQIQIKAILQTRKARKTHKSLKTEIIWLYKLANKNRNPLKCQRIAIQLPILLPTLPPVITWAQEIFRYARRQGTSRSTRTKVRKRASDEANKAERKINKLPISTQLFRKAL